MTVLPFAVAETVSAAARTEPARPALPRAPQTPEETGLPLTFLVELTAKLMHQRGINRLTELSAQLCLPGTVVEAICNFMRSENLLEIARRGQLDADVQFELTQAGRARAGEWLARNSYAGAAPVTLEAYRERTQAQSASQLRITAPEVRRAFDGLIVPERLQDLFGTAVNSGRPMLVYGPAGSGKTYLAERLCRLLQGAIAVPHAIYVQGEVVRVYDAHCHQPAAEAGASASVLDLRAKPDTRWVLCERPVVVSGGELTLEMLDLTFDARAGYYQAPPHFKANNGVFIVDDLGRQVVTPRELMNRWIVPMERRHDHLMLRNGAKFTIPFDMLLVFSSNLQPADLEDAAFLRRLGHKIHVGELGETDYRTLFERACDVCGVQWQPDTFYGLLRRLHEREGRERLACYPRDLVQLIASRAAYLGVPAVLSEELLEWAWRLYFVTR